MLNASWHVGVLPSATVHIVSIYSGASAPEGLFIVPIDGGKFKVDALQMFLLLKYVPLKMSVSMSGYFSQGILIVPIVAGTFAVGAPGLLFALSLFSSDGFPVR